MLHACMEWTLKTHSTTRAPSAAQPSEIFTAFALTDVLKAYSRMQREAITPILPTTLACL